MASIFAQNPEFDISVDIFACASTLGSLTRFACATSQPFSMVVEIIGTTAFFLRREKAPDAIIKDIYGYGHTFPEAYTTWDNELAGSTSHQRIINYRFGGLSLLLRFESDGYIGSQTPAFRTSGDGVSVDDLLTGLAGNSAASQAWEIGQGGHVVAQSAIFDLKTRSIKKMSDDALGTELPRLWVRQISKLILAFHTSGLFNDVVVNDVRDRVQQWEADSETELQKCVGLLRHIIAVARNSSRGKVEVRNLDGKALELREVPGHKWTALPGELEQEWATSQEAISKADLDHLSGNIQEAREDQSYKSDEDEGVALDYTACSAEGCGYCGRCSS